MTAGGKNPTGHWAADAMGAKVELFPTFQELCAQARNIEKKPLSVPASPIDGKLVLDENIGIFPREFDDYTYSYLLFEAQKVERRLYKDEFAAESSAPVAAPRLSPEQQMEGDLHRFVEAQGQEDLQEEEDDLMRSLRKKGKEAPGKSKTTAQMPEEEEPGIEEMPVPEPEEEAPMPPAAKARILPPRILPARQPSPVPQAPAPRAREEKLAAPQEQEEQPPLPEPPAVQEPKVTAAPRVQRLPPAEQEMAQGASSAPAKLSSYSKLSPRLKALLEAKLRREEEKSREKREAQDSLVKTPPPPEDEPEDMPGPEPEEEGEPEEKGRLETLRKPMPEEDEGEHEIMRKPMPDDEEPSEEDSGPPAKLPLRKISREEYDIDDDEPGIGKEEAVPGAEEEPGLMDEEEELPEPEAPMPEEIKLPAKKQEKEAGQREPMLIKPMFPDAAGKPQSGEESDRMRRIQRILGELSPDRMRQQPKLQEDFSLDKPEHSEPEDGVVGEAPVPEEKPAPAILAKKTARGRKKKEAALPVGKKAPSKKPVKLPEAAPEVEAEEPEEMTVPAAAPKKPVPVKLQPPAREEEPEEQEEVPIARKKLMPRIPAKEEEPEDQAAPRRLRSPAEAEEEEPEAQPARKKLIPRIPPREEEPADEDEEEKPAVRVRRRILPGMMRTKPGAPRTYVPPARKAVPAPEEEEPEEQVPRKKMPVREDQEPEPDEEPAPEEEKVSPSIAPLKPRKLVSDEAPEEHEKTPEQIAQDEKMRKMAQQLARLEAGRIKEISGTASLPEEDEGIPLPDDSDDVPKPEKYGQAKEMLRRNLEHDEVARKVRQEEEVTVEQFAKANMVWLYEIYKMGGMSREDFLQKASAKYSESKSGAPPSPLGDGGQEPPPNPALANLSKEIGKKDKK